MTTVIFDGKIFILHEGKRTRSYKRLDVTESFDSKRTTISFVTDYVVFNLQKTEDKYWPQGAASPIQGRKKHKSNRIIFIKMIFCFKLIKNR